MAKAKKSRRNAYLQKRNNMHRNIICVSDCDEFANAGFERVFRLTDETGRPSWFPAIDYYDQTVAKGLVWFIDWRQHKSEAAKIVSELSLRANTHKFPTAMIFYLDSPSDENAIQCWCSDYSRVMRLLYASTHKGPALIEELAAACHEERELIERNCAIQEDFARHPAHIELSQEFRSSTNHFITLGFGEMRDFMHDLRMKIRLIYRESISAPKGLTREKIEIAKDKLLKAFSADKTIPPELLNIFSNDRSVDSPPNLLLTGETGTGKTLLARLIFKLLKISCADQPVSLNSSGISETMLENQLFGCLKGSATSITGRLGAALDATYGMLFFDEIGDLPLPLQARLLTFLDRSNLKVKPDGFDKEIGPLKLYIVAATNKNLEDEVRKGNFRSDLLNRFQLKIDIPPMNKRRDDIPELIKFCLATPAINQTLLEGNSETRQIRKITGELVDFLCKCDYESGNYRKLEEMLSECVNSATRNFSEIIDLSHLPERFKKPAAQHATPSMPSIKKTEGLVSDEAWKKIKKILPPKLPSGPNRTNYRMTVEGILWHEKNSKSWKSIPARFGSSSTCWRTYKKLIETGLWDRIRQIIEQN